MAPPIKELPLIDVAPLVHRSSEQAQVAEALGAACRAHGFFYITGHGVDLSLQRQLEEASRAFFALPEQEKLAIHMPKGGRAWRGYFPVGEELTSGKPDLKEGLYFGEELPETHPKVQAAVPMHGRNLFPRRPALLGDLVLAYMQALTQLGHHLMRGLSLSLGLPETYLYDHYTSDAFTLFRIFHYPGSISPEQEGQWGVGTHTDYGLLTILKQDEVGGLQIQHPNGWLDAPYLPDSFVCNIGDMLDFLSQGRYRSTPHRVRNTSRRGRLSFPFFFDPGFDAPLRPLPLGHLPLPSLQQQERWDQADLQAVEGTYGQYVLNKVAKVFPKLMEP